MNSYIKYLIIPLSIIIGSFNNITNAVEYNYSNLAGCISKVLDYYSDKKMKNIVSNPNMDQGQIDYIKILAEAADMSNKWLEQYLSDSGNSMSTSDYNRVLTKTSLGNLIYMLSWGLSVDFNKYQGDDLFLKKIKQCYKADYITSQQYKALLQFLLFTAITNEEYHQVLTINEQFSKNLIKDYIDLLNDTEFNIVPDNTINKVIEDIKPILKLASYVDSNTNRDFEHKITRYNITNYKGSNDCIEFIYEPQNYADNSKHKLINSDKEIDEKLHISEIVNSLNSNRFNAREINKINDKINNMESDQDIADFVDNYELGTINNYTNNITSNNKIDTPNYDKQYYNKTGKMIDYQYNDINNDNTNDDTEDESENEDFERDLY